jgi:hypothetical protein
MEIAKELKKLPKKKISEIHDLQGNLKDLTETNYNKLLTRIMEQGFKYPFYVWIDSKGKYWTLDGHQRKRVIEKAFGKDVEVPYIEIQAKDETAAKKEILAISSDYGEVTKDGFDEFTANFLNEDFEEIKNEMTFDRWFDKDLDIAGDPSLESRSEDRGGMMSDGIKFTLGNVTRFIRSDDENYQNAKDLEDLMMNATTTELTEILCKILSVYTSSESI